MRCEHDRPAASRRDLLFESWTLGPVCVCVRPRATALDTPGCEGVISFDAGGLCARAVALVPLRSCVGCGVQVALRLSSPLHAQACWTSAPQTQTQTGAMRAGQVALVIVRWVRAIVVILSMEAVGAAAAVASHDQVRAHEGRWGEVGHYCHSCVQLQGVCTWTVR